MKILMANLAVKTGLKEKKNKIVKVCVQNSFLQFVCMIICFSTFQLIFRLVTSADIR